MSNGFFFYSFCLLLETASDCHELFLRGETTSGVYVVQPKNAEPFKVFCEMTAGKWRETDNRCFVSFSEEKTSISRWFG